MTAKRFLFFVCIVLLLVLVGINFTLTLIGSRPAAAPLRTTHAAEILRLNIPAVTHGFEKTSRLPNGDLFLLRQPFQMAVTDAPEGAQVFPVKLETFGGDSEAIGGLPTTSPQGFALSTRNQKAQAISCAESIWDGNFTIASTPGTDGDTVRVFLQDPDSEETRNLALFTIRNASVIISDKHPEIMLYVNDRYAVGKMWMKGESLPFALGAGTSGSRTDLITMSWPMGAYSELQGCFRVGVEISRGNTEGTTSVVITDIVVNRNRIANDETNPGVGLLGHLTGGYPTGFPCKAQCPFPEDPNPPFPDPQQPPVGSSDVCNTICFRSPQHFALNVMYLPIGAVMIGGVNFNSPVSTGNRALMAAALRGSATPLQRLNQEWVAAQLNLLHAGGYGSPSAYFALEGKLKCYGLRFDPITLSNGFTLSPDTQLKDLFQQVRFCIRNDATDDMAALTTVLDLLNGNDPMYRCNQKQ